MKNVFLFDSTQVRTVKNVTSYWELRVIMLL